MTRTRVTPEYVEAVVVSETFTTLPSGKVVICEITLLNGFTVIGKSGVVDIKSFDMAKAMEISRRKAIDEIYQLEGYLLQEELYYKGKE
jgi:hypothetical protein